MTTKAEVIRNDVKAQILDEKTGRKRFLAVGDIIEITDFVHSEDDAENGSSLYYNSQIEDNLPVCFYWSDAYNKNWIPLTAVTILPEKDVVQCTCDISLLMTSGCQCGAIAMERSRDKA